MYNYPKEIKAFYMRLNDDKKTVAAMDVLVPKVCYYLFTVIHETHSPFILACLVRSR